MNCFPNWSYRFDVSDVSVVVFHEAAAKCAWRALSFTLSGAELLAERHQQAEHNLKPQITKGEPATPATVVALFRAEPSRWVGVRSWSGVRLSSRLRPVLVPALDILARDPDPEVSQPASRLYAQALAKAKAA